MRISQVGGIIAAASQKVVKPMMQVGSIPIIRRIVITFQQAGVFPIVVITGVDEDKVKYELADYGVIFISTDLSANPKLLECAKIGMGYLEGKCDRVVFTPVNNPMFSPATLQKLIHAQGEMVSPCYEGRCGHPFVLSAAALRHILDYQGESGLPEALEPLSSSRTIVEVEDRGILLSVHDEEELQKQLASHNQAILHPRIRMTIEREASFFNARLKLLLFLISDTNNMRKACAAMALSYGNAWDMINRLERELGYFVVKRTQGGRRGGNTTLTEQGETFLLTCQKYEETVFQFAQKQFQELFILSKIMQ